MVRSPTSLAREEERRKIIQLEEGRRRKGQGASVSRSGSRVSKIVGKLILYLFKTNYFSISKVF